MKQLAQKQDWLDVNSQDRCFEHTSDAYLVRMKKQDAARAARAVMKLRRPAPVYRQNSMPPTSTAMAEPPEKAAEICNHRGSAKTVLDLQPFLSFITCKVQLYPAARLPFPASLGQRTAGNDL